MSEKSFSFQEIDQESRPELEVAEYWLIIFFF